MLMEIDPYYPETHLTREVALLLERGGVAIVPTDTVYALVCDINSRKGIQKLTKIKGGERKKLFSIVLEDMSQIGTYTGYISSFAYRTMKRLLPGPYTFIVEASSLIPKLMKTRRSTIGIRIPDCPIAQSVAHQLGNPLVATTLGVSEEDFLSDPMDLDRAFGDQVDLVVDGGVIYGDPSSVVDLAGSVPEIIREGAGDVSLFE
jgi:tRNA threonylcarbamoyl adenosine modification protein (Sua5/YciO/YrdC/YwlC family)